MSAAEDSTSQAQGSPAQFDTTTSATEDSTSHAQGSSGQWDTTSTSNTEDSTYQDQGSPDYDEFAGAKLWAVYISEAENYDKALIESWKSDMEGLLIFAGLFSASLTAFLIESYKTLNADQGTITIAVLAQISLQLDARSNASAVNISSLEAYTPNPASLACNILWFLSLWASLSCALIATLVQQWARDFMQRAEMRPSPIIRARIFSYLYFGLRRFGMHKVVEFIPLLLHMSLLLFFAGLVAFLIPVNRALMTMTAILLGVIAAAYAYLTVLPIFSSDSPYRTALSNVVWGLFRRFSVLLHSRPRCNSDEESIIPHHGSPVPTKTIPTMVEIMTRDAVQKSTKRDERDARAIIWTVQSLTDDNELEPFVEALPELIWGPTGRRTGHDDMIKLLLHTGELRLVSRIEGLLRSCDTGLLPPDRETRRRIFCIKALWAIGYFSASNNSMRNSFPVFDPSILRSRLADTALVKSHLTSTYSLVRWNGFQSLSALIREIISVLENAGNSNSTRLQDPHVLLQTAQREAERQGYSDLSEVFSSLIAIHPVDTPVLFQRARDACITFDDAAYDILTEYLCSCATLEDEPYEFDATCRMMVERLPVPPTPQLEIKLKTSFNNIIDQHGDKLNVHREPHHIDGIVGTILKLLPESFDAEFARHVVLYLMCRTIPSKALYRGLGQCNPKFIGSLLTTSLASNARDLHTKLAQIFWFAVDRSRSVLAHFDEETLAAVSGVPHLFVSSCAVAVLKTRILMAGAEIPPDQLNALMDRLQIPNLAFDVPTSMSTTARWKEGLFLILMDFLEKTDELSMSDEWNHERAADVFRFLVAVHPWERVSHSLQRRFAAWFLKKVVALHTQLIKVILYWNNRALLESLDDHVARRTICEALNTYLVTFSDKQGESMLYNNILAWLVELDPLPSENIPIDPTALTAPITTTTSSGSHQSEKIDG